MMDNQTITAVDPSSFTVLNAMSLQAFIARLADIFEHSPWVPQRVGHLRPFRDVGQLHKAMVSAVAQASPAEQLTLLRAHPELAGKEAQQGGLTAASYQEQARAGLKALSPAEMKRITGLNAAYLERHGFPFIVCVGNHTKQSLFLEFDRRLDNLRESEMREALGQVADIALLRLNAQFSV
jgi:2-oxo-4-hydroxy-4-carboxy-5-ureidoimidazoline decarboxylase